jgi:hypothetical protein
MKVYLVVQNDHEREEDTGFTVGVFSTREKAEEHCRNIYWWNGEAWSCQYDRHIEVDIEEWEVDEPYCY